MGLFGLFATAFGLGAITKDAISDSFDDDRQYEIAKKENRPWYTINGYKTMSTKTRRPALISYENGHCKIVDLKTNTVIEDVTKTDNINRELDEKADTQKMGWAFYRKCDWDVRGYKCNIWVSDRICGYFKKQVCGDRTWFELGTLRDCKWNSFDTKEVYVNYENKKEFNVDGTPIVHLKKEERVKNREIERARKESFAFYRNIPDFGRNVKTPIGYTAWFSIENDAPYLFNFSSEYFQKAVVTRDINGKETWELDYFADRISPDGSKFVNRV